MPLQDKNNTRFKTYTTSRLPWFDILPVRILWNEGLAFYLAPPASVTSTATHAHFYCPVEVTGWDPYFWR